MTEDVGKLGPHSYKGVFYTKEKTHSNGHLRLRSKVTKDTNDPKG